MSLFLSDEYAELSLREKYAARALKSALVGVCFFPLQLYTSFLILKVAHAVQPLRSRYFWYTVIAGIVVALQTPAVLLVLFYLTFHY